MDNRLLQVEILANDLLNHLYGDLFLLQPNRLANHTFRQRQITMYLAKKYTDSSFSHIGKIVGKKDHATVLHACKTIKDQIETSKSFRSSVEEIEVLLKN